MKKASSHVNSREAKVAKAKSTKDMETLGLLIIGS